MNVEKVNDGRKCTNDAECELQPLQNDMKKSDAPPPHFFPRYIFHQALRCGVLVNGDDPKEFYRAVRWLFNDLRPVGAMESMLAGQIIGTYLVISYQLYKSTQDTYLEGTTARINLVVKLQRVLTQQLSLLASLRGMCSQKVRIERIDITGGQSIIGSQVGRG